MKKVTLETVAQKAGVSKATVSYVLTGKKKISTEVTQRVINAVQELNYRPHILARNLAGGRTHTIGLFSAPTTVIREDTYFNSMISGILDALHERGYYLQIHAEFAEDQTENGLQINFQYPLDGFLITNLHINHIYLNRVMEMNIPFVLIGTPYNSTDYFYVDFDLIASTYESTKYLLNRGIHKIYFINSPQEYIQSLQREEGIALAFKEKGVSFERKNVKYSHFLEHEGYRLCNQIVEENPQVEAIMACNDLTTIGVLQALKERKIEVPKQIAVMCTSGHTILAKVYSPKITCIEFDSYTQGYEAAKMIVEVVEKKRFSPSHHILPIKFISGETA